MSWSDLHMFLQVHHLTSVGGAWLSQNLLQLSLSFSVVLFSTKCLWWFSWSDDDLLQCVVGRSSSTFEMESTSSLPPLALGAAAVVHLSRTCSGPQKLLWRMKSSLFFPLLPSSSLSRPPWLFGLVAMSSSYLHTTCITDTWLYRFIWFHKINFSIHLRIKKVLLIHVVTLSPSRGCKLRRTQPLRVSEGLWRSLKALKVSEGLWRSLKVSEGL